jgi:hypothetical protein
MSANGKIAATDRKYDIRCSLVVHLSLIYVDSSHSRWRAQSGFMAKRILANCRMYSRRHAPNMGRVCGGHYRDNYALSSSPFVCIVDTIMMLVKLAWMLYVGCSFQTATRYVWYDRFKREPPLFDNTWKILAAMFAGASHSSVPADSSLIAIGLRTNNQDNTLAGIEYEDTPPNHSHRRVVSVLSHDMNTTWAHSQPNSLVLVERPSVVFIAQRNANDPFTRKDYGIVQNSNLEADTSNGSSLGFNKHSEPYEGSAIDRMWRLSMASFIIGALPQAIKVFGMRGVLLTQTLVAFLVVSFLVPEIIRMVAGTAGAFDLHPEPIVIKAKTTFANVELCALSISIMFAYLVFTYIVVLSLSTTRVTRPSNGDSGIQFRPEYLEPQPVKSATPFDIAIVFLSLAGGMIFIPYVQPILRQGLWDFWVKMRPSFAKGVSVLVAFDPPLSTASFESTLFYLIVSYVMAGLYAACLLFFSYRYLRDTTDSAAYALNASPSPKTALREITRYYICFTVICAFVFIPIFATLLYFVYRLIFMGSLSRYPRRLFGIAGTMSEFLAGAFVLLNLVSSFVGYLSLWYEFGDFRDTYKPGWADALG